jgi:4-hydroxy-2-oxoheptanedioate aldolase
MRQNHTLANLRTGKPALGQWMHSSSVHIARALAVQKIFDWILVDMEHAPTDLLTASMMLGAIADISGGMCTPLARIPQATPYHIKQVLDGGAQGIIVPMVSTAQDTADIVRWSRYPPVGDRGAGGMLRALSFGTTNSAEYLANANDEILVGIQIETREAVENIEEIVAVPGLDMIFIGPNDLHLSLGLTPSLWSEQPGFVEATNKVIAAAQRARMPLGTLVYGADGAKARLAQGFNFIGLDSEINQMLRALNAEYQQIRPALS